ncbi:hypothetical protein ABTY20_19005 [Streptomyces sp. NPDC126497]|uniref:hypothetical protein n=1 Tax=Streptomyces sp. NPDC126497 TaxID=3155313 RepID=UPI0033255F8D
MVVGLDPATPAGIAFARVHVDPELLRAHLDEVSRNFQRIRENAARMTPIVQRAGREMSRSLANMQVDPPISGYDADGAMRWSPPADGEETPPCPA